MRTFHVGAQGLAVLMALIVAVLLVSGASAAVVTEYGFDGDLLDTGADSVFVDDLTSYNPVQEVTPATFQPGVVGQAVELGLAEGLASVLSAADSDDLDLAGDYTLEMFVHPEPEHGNHWHRLVEKWVGAMQYHFAINYPVDGLDLFMNAGNIFDGEATAPVPANAWSHVAFTGDSAAGETKIWVNGINVGTAPYVAVDPGTAPLEFGNVNSPGQQDLQYSGLIDEFAIHNVAVDEAYMLSRAAMLPGVLTWDGSDNSWNNASRWDGPAAPTILSPAVIPSGTVTVTAPARAHDLTVNTGGVAIDPGQSLTLYQAANFAPGTTLNLGAGATLSAGGGSISRLNTAGDSVVNTSDDMTIGTLHDGGIAGIFTKQGTGTLSLSNAPAGGVVAGQTTIKIQQGTLASVGADPLGGSSLVELAGGKLLVNPPPPAVAPPMPTDNLVLHLNAGAIVAGDGDPIETWSDLSGQGNDATQFNWDNQPTYRSAGIGGEPVVHFDGDDYITTATAFGNPYTIFTVSQLEGSQDFRLITSADVNWLLGYWNGGKDVMYASGFIPNEGVPTDTEPHLYEAQGTGGATSFYGNGKLLGASNVATLPIGQLQLGAWGAGATEASVGDVAEVLIYDRAISAADRSAAGLYLAMKYGLDTSYAGEIPLNMTGTAISVTADSAIEALGSPTNFGPLTMKAGALTTLGTEGGVTFTATTVDPAAQWVGFDPQVPTKWDGVSQDMDGIDAANVANVTIAKAGTSTWTVSKAPQNLAATAKLEVAGGILELRGTDPFGGRDIKVSAGTLDVLGRQTLGSSPIEMAGGRLLISPQGNAPIPPAGGLIANWQFEDATDLGLDSVNPGRSRTEIGSPAQAAGGKVGGALLLDGGSHLELGTEDMTQNYSVAGWLNVAQGVPNGWRTAAGFWTVGNMWMHYGFQPAGNFGDHGGGETSGLPLNGTVDRDTWYHVVSIRDGMENQLWINGVMAAQTSSGTPEPIGDAFLIGTKDHAGGNHWIGMIDELYVYDRSLSPQEVGNWYLGYLGAVDMTATEVTVTADSRIDVDGLSGSFGDLTVSENAVLTTAGTLQGIDFAKTTIVPGVTEAGFDTQTNTTPGPLTAGSVTIVKRGPADLILDSPDNSLTDVTFDVQDGRLVGYHGPNPFGAAPLNLSGGEVLLSARVGAASPVSYLNPVTVATSGAITAGQGGQGADAPMTVELGGPAGDAVTLNAGATVTFSSTDGYELSVLGPVSGPGGLSVTEGTVTLAQGGNVSSMEVTDGSLALGADLTVATASLQGGTLDTGTNRLIVHEALTVADFVKFGIDQDHSFAATTSNPWLSSDLTLSGGKFTIDSLSGGTPQIPTQGLVAQWQFENPADLGSDSVNPGRAYSEIGAPAHTTDGKFGGALDVDGASWLELDSTGISGIYSISAWVSLSTVDGAWHNVTGDWGNWAHLGYDTSVAGTFGDHGGGPTRGAPDDGPIEADRWYHLVSVRDAGALGENQLWIDGVKVAETSAGFATDPASGRISIGNSYVGGGGFPWIGQIDELYVYDRALTPDDVAQLYEPTVVGAELQLETVNLTVTEDTQIDAAATSVTLGNLTVADGVKSLALDSAVYSFQNARIADGTTIDAEIEVRAVLDVGNGVGEMTVGVGELVFGPEAVYNVELSVAGQVGDADTIVLGSGSALSLDGELKISGMNDRDASDSWSNDPVTIISNRSGAPVGWLDNSVVPAVMRNNRFATVSPEDGTHLGHGVFLRGVDYVNPAGNVITKIDLDVFIALGGDADGDKKVWLSDWAALRANFGNTATDKTWTEGNFDPWVDGKVWLSDWAALRANFGNSDYTAAGAAAVPEPGTIVMLLGAMAAFALAVRRRASSISTH